MKKFNILTVLVCALLLITSTSHAQSENKMTYKMNLMEDAMYVDVKIETEHTGFKFAIDVPKGAEVYDVEGKSLRDSFLSGTKYIFDFKGGDKEVSYKIKGLPKAFKRADGFVFGLYRSFNTHIHSIDIYFDSVYYDEPDLRLYDSLSSFSTKFDSEYGPMGLSKITAPIDLALSVKYPKNEFVNAPYKDMDFEDYRNEELTRIQLKRIDKPGISELVLKGIIAIALLGFVIVGFLMTKNQRFRNKFSIKKKYEEEERSGKTFDKLVEDKLSNSYEVLLKKGYIEKENSDYSVALTKKGRLKLEEILIKKEYLLNKESTNSDEEKFLRLFR